MQRALTLRVMFALARVVRAPHWSIRMSRTLPYSLIVAAMVLPQPIWSASLQPTLPPQPPVKARIISVRIAADRSIYGVGESIKIRTTLINRSTHELNVDRAPPYALVKLEIFDAERTVAPSASPFCDGCINSAIGLALPPGKPVVVGFFDSYNHWAPAEWADIRHWGYDIKRPGSYTILALSYMYAIGAGVAQFQTSPTDKSNEVHITMTRGPIGSYNASAMRHSCDIVEAQAIDAVQPNYPESIRNRAVGRVIVEVEVIVGPAGNLMATQVVKSSGNLLIDGAAVRAARESSYSPKTVCGQPTRGSFLFRAVFQQPKPKTGASMRPE